MNERVKKLRKTLNLTLEGFGKKLGVTRSEIGHIENGNRKITEQMIMAICREFNVNEDWLRNGAGEMFKPIPKTTLETLRNEYDLSQLEFAILENYLNLNDDERKAVCGFVENIFTDFTQTHVALKEKIEDRKQNFMQKTDTSKIDTVAAAEAEYEKSLGIVPRGKSTVSSITNGIENERKGEAG